MTDRETNGGWNLDTSYASLPELFYSKLAPTVVSSPQLVQLNEALALELGLDPQGLTDPEGVAVLAGNQVPEGAVTLAQAYAGHQFGHFTILGDGRALLIGEQITPSGARYDIQLKGSGPTPYSRGGDGRATLGSMLREYIISEAMHKLGIPTTRSLAVVNTGEQVYRETPLLGAVLTRVARSHLRVGTFQYAADRGGLDATRALADYAIERHFPEAAEAAEPYLAFLRAMAQDQAALIAQWQLVGFIHGVMNTDNMAISGETIDYGPCAFMDTYDPETVYSSIDHHGRYAYRNQPAIGAWNVARFAETLLPLLHSDEQQAVAAAQQIVSDFGSWYNQQWLSGMRKKLGLQNEEADDGSLVQELLNLMHTHKADYTNTFTALTFHRLEGQSLFASSAFHDWHEKWQRRRTRQDCGEEMSQRLMRSNNPAIIPRNHRVEEALAAAVEDGNYDPMERLLRVLADPFAHCPDQEAYRTPPPADAEHYVTFCGT